MAGVRESSLIRFYRRKTSFIYTRLILSQAGIYLELAEVPRGKKPNQNPTRTAKILGAPENYPMECGTLYNCKHEQPCDCVSLGDSMNKQNKKQKTKTKYTMEAGQHLRLWAENEGQARPGSSGYLLSCYNTAQCFT